MIVNRSFADAFLVKGAPPGEALGLRFRYVSPYERPRSSADLSYEVVGVVDDFPRFPPEPGASGTEGTPAIYHPAAAGDVHPVTFSVRFSESVPADFGDRFRTLGAAVDPSLQLRSVMPLTGFYDQLRSFWTYLAWGVSLLTISVLLLSAAGIYAMMSFTVAQRTREIAIRAALGAAPRRLVMNIFGRAARQLSLGLAAGSLFSAAVFQNTEYTTAQALVLTLAVAGVFVVIGLLAAAGPARRGLRIQASEALKADA